ncbi:MAG: haloacid dehalogenase [Chloroflexaceae bacterium]|nr:haloacid dehalogenase [Chloroflexaceae bacterium]NJO04589.1 haloacid dehalogenase [Chloroflexaceae bacterium]
MSIETVVATCVAQIDAAHGSREQALTVSRSLVRQCANTIRAAHRAQYTEAQALLNEAAMIVATLRAAVADQPLLLGAGYTQDALKEYAEAALVYAFLTNGQLPTPEALGVEPAAYLNGLCEAASELRRAILDRLRRDELEASEHLLTIMDDVYSLLITVDYPDAVTGGLRRATDALRAVLERTRGDLTTALRQDRLMHALAKVEQQLDDDTASST